VYICDKNNHRIVRFPAGADFADRVWGWPTLTTAGAAAVPPTSSSLNFPEDVALYDGGLFVCDGGNNRLVFYASLTSTFASSVWGQPDFSSCVAASPPTASSLKTINGVVFNRAGKMMFVADTGTTLHHRGMTEC
jgi:hypothetical protein